MSAAKWGLLSGVAQGVGQAANTWLTNEMEMRKEARLREYQKELQQETWARDDKVRGEERANQLVDKEGDRAFQKEIVGEEREFRSGERAEDRKYNEGLLTKQWSREDQIRAESYGREDSKQSKYEDVYDATGNVVGQRDTKTNKLVPMTSSSRLDPMVDARLKSLNSEISALQRNEFLDEAKQTRLDALISERDSVFQGGKPTPAPKKTIIPVGHVEDGYKFTGGNPNDPDSWVKVK